MRKGEQTKFGDHHTWTLRLTGISVPCPRHFQQRIKTLRNQTHKPPVFGKNNSIWYRSPMKSPTPTGIPLITTVTSPGLALTVWPISGMSKLSSFSPFLWPLLGPQAPNVVIVIQGLSAGWHKILGSWLTFVSKRMNSKHSDFEDRSIMTEGPDGLIFSPLYDFARACSVVFVYSKMTLQDLRNWPSDREVRCMQPNAHCFHCKFWFLRQRGRRIVPFPSFPLKWMDGSGIGGGQRGLVSRNLRMAEKQVRWIGGLPKPEVPR